MESRGPLATWHGLLLLLPLMPPSHAGRALRHTVPSQRTQDPPALHLSNGPGQEPVTIMTFNLTKITKTSSSYEFRTWDPEGVIFYGDTNPKDDWFVLGLWGGRPEVQLHNHWAQLTVVIGPWLDDGRWHQLEVKIHRDSVLLGWMGRRCCLRLRQVSGPLAYKPQPIMRIAVGRLLFPASNLWLPHPHIFPFPHGLQLVPALDGCLRQHDWLDQQAQSSASVPTGLRSCSVESQPGIFFPPGTGAERSLQDIPQPHVEPWAFSLDLGLQLAAGSGPLLALGTPENPTRLSLHLQDQVVLSSGSEPGLDLPLVLGLPLQLNLTVSRVVLSQGPKKEMLTLPPVGPGSLFNLWAQLQGHLFLGALPGEASSASFCLDGLWAQGQRLDMDRALSRNQDIWTHSCPQSPSNGTDTTY